MASTANRATRRKKRNINNLPTVRKNSQRERTTGITGGTGERPEEEKSAIFYSLSSHCNTGGDSSFLFHSLCFSPCSLWPPWFFFMLSGNRPKESEMPQKKQAGNGGDLLLVFIKYRHARDGFGRYFS